MTSLISVVKLIVMVVVEVVVIEMNDEMVT